MGAVFPLTDGREEAQGKKAARGFLELQFHIQDTAKEPFFSEGFDDKETTGLHGASKKHPDLHLPLTFKEKVTIP